MATLAGIFFSIISIFGLIRCKEKKYIKKMVLVAFSLLLILVQLLFINSILLVGGDEFVALSGLVSGIILILATQRTES